MNNNDKNLRLRKLSNDSKFDPVEFWNRRAEAALENEIRYQRFLEFTIEAVPERVELGTFVGCGSCNELVYFHRLADRFVCCDISDVAIELASSRWCWTTTVDFRLCECEEPFRGVACSLFDVIVTSSLFKHLRSPIAESVLREFVRVLKAGGKYVCIEPTFTIKKLNSIDESEQRRHMSYRTSHDFVDLITSGTGFRKLDSKGLFYSFVLE